MKKLTVFTNFDDNTRLLSDAEMGRLFRAMLKYASSGAEPNLSGNERFLWDTAKGDIDRQKEAYEVICERNKNNRNQSSPNTSSRYATSPVVTSRDDWTERKEKKRKENKRTKETPAEPETPFEIALDEFRQYRKESKHPLTELAEKKLLSELEKLSGGDDEKKIQILDQSIRNDWRGVFALNEKNTRQNYAQHPVSNLDHLLVNLDD